MPCIIISSSSIVMSYLIINMPPRRLRDGLPDLVRDEAEPLHLRFGAGPGVDNNSNNDNNNNNNNSNSKSNTNNNSQ